MVAALVALAVTLVAFAVAPPAARASHQQVSILEEDDGLYYDPAATLQEMRHLGVDMARVLIPWYQFAPDPTSHTMPQFNASDPNAYPAGTFARLDTIVLDANAFGIRLMFGPAGGSPLWAQGPNPGRYGAHYSDVWSWEPNAAAFAAFVRALGTRYSGTFVPPGSTTPLPHVGVWEIFNEPNTGEALGPEAIDGSRVAAAPRMYRALADGAWSALQATGHAGDTILIGALGSEGYQAPPSRRYPQGLPGTYGAMAPVPFIRELYCLDPNYHRYLGRAASLRGCPTTRAGYAKFVAQNPVLFHASGFSDHPYNLANPGLPPNRATNPNWGWISEMPHLGATLNQVLRTYGSAKYLPIWNTEYGYITCPPTCHFADGRRSSYVSPAKAAFYINWAEYLSWRSPGTANTMQYLLYDPNPRVGVSEYGGFASGLVFYHGSAKPIYYAYRMPVFLPVTQTRKGRALEVWGDVRPAPYAVADLDGPQYASIQFQRRGSGTWTTLKTLNVTDPHGYIDTRVAFPSSGYVRISWTYPASDTRLQSSMVANSSGPIFSRTVSVTITRR